MVKVVSFFLIGMIVLAMFGKLRIPKLPKLSSRKTIETAKKCRKCGTYLINNKPCDCSGGKNGR